MNGSHVLANGDGVLVSSVATVAAGDLASVSAVNSGYAWSESGSSLTWTSLCQTFLWWSHYWASLGYNRTHGLGNR